MSRVLLFCLFVTGIKPGGALRERNDAATKVSRGLKDLVQTEVERASEGVHLRAMAWAAGRIIEFVVAAATADSRLFRRMTFNAACVPIR